MQVVLKMKLINKTVALVITACTLINIVSPILNYLKLLLLVVIL